jgi:hypothetical protein
MPVVERSPLTWQASRITFTDDRVTTVSGL